MTAPAVPFTRAGEVESQEADTPRELSSATLLCTRFANGKPANAELLFEVCGDLDDTLVARMRESIFSAAATRPRRIVVDLARVGFVDAVGLRTLIAARRRCTAGGTGFALRRPSRAVQRLLSQTRLDTVFDVEPAR